jgi:hypothetical protein
MHISSLLVNPKTRFVGTQRPVPMACPLQSRLSGGDDDDAVAGLGAVVAAVAVGLCVAIVRERPARPSPARGFTAVEALAA